MSLAAYVQSLPEARGSGDALVSLYADLSGTRASNPGAFRAKVEWWARTLGHVLWTGLLPSAVTLTVDEALPNAFALASAGRPMCIAVVLVRGVAYAGRARTRGQGDAAQRVSRARTAPATCFVRLDVGRLSRQARVARRRASLDGKRGDWRRGCVGGNAGRVGIPAQCRGTWSCSQSVPPSSTAKRWTASRACWTRS